MVDAFCLQTFQTFSNFQLLSIRLRYQIVIAITRCMVQVQCYNETVCGKRKWERFSFKQRAVG